MRGGRTMLPPTVPRPPCPDAQGGLPSDTRGGHRQGAPPQDAPARSAPAIPQRTGWPPPGDTQGGRHLTRTMPTASPVRTALIGRRQDAPARSAPPSHSFGHHPTRTTSTASPPSARPRSVAVFPPPPVRSLPTPTPQLFTGRNRGLGTLENTQSPILAKTDLGFLECRYQTPRFWHTKPRDSAGNACKKGPEPREVPAPWKRLAPLGSPGLQDPQNPQHSQRLQGSQRPPGAQHLQRSQSLPGSQGSQDTPDRIPRRRPGSAPKA